MGNVYQGSGRKRQESGDKWRHCGLPTYGSQSRKDHENFWPRSQNKYINHTMSGKIKKKKAKTKNNSTSYCVHSPIQETLNGYLHLYHLFGTIIGDKLL